jgi:hypothetical protein
MAWLTDAFITTHPISITPFVVTFIYYFLIFGNDAGTSLFQRLLP